MDSQETHQQQQNRNAAAALPDPTSTSQAVHNRPSVGALSLSQPQTQQALMLNASPYTVATQQPWMQLGTEQRGTTRKDAPPDGGDSGGGANAVPPAKRGKGRPLGSRTKNRRNALGGEGEPLTAHVIDVNTGEDIAMKFMAFVNQEPRNVCILSASGAVSSAVFLSMNPIGFIRLQAGFYVITSMSGAFSNTESNGTVTKIGNMYVSLAGPDCKVVGGCVGGGMLIAASPVKLIVGIFGPEEVKLSAASSSTPANVLHSSGDGPGLPQSQGPQRSSVSSVGNASTSLGNTTPQPPHHLPLWPGNFPQ